MNNRLKLSRLAGAPPPHPLNVDLKVSEMSAFGPPQGCASGSLWVNINKKSLKMSFFIKNEGLVKLRKKKYGHFSKWFLAEGRFPAASGFWRKFKNQMGLIKPLLVTMFLLITIVFWPKTTNKLQKNPKNHKNQWFPIPPKEDDGFPIPPKEDDGGWGGTLLYVFNH